MGTTVGQDHLAKVVTTLRIDGKLVSLYCEISIRISKLESVFSST